MGRNKSLLYFIWAFPQAQNKNLSVDLEKTRLYKLKAIFLRAAATVVQVEESRHGKK